MLAVVMTVAFAEILLPDNDTDAEAEADADAVAVADADEHGHFIGNLFDSN